MLTNTRLALLFAGIALLAGGCAKKDAGWDLLDAYYTCTTLPCYQNAIRLGMPSWNLGAAIRQAKRGREQISKYSRSYVKATDVTTVEYYQYSGSGGCFLALSLKDGELVRVSLSGECSRWTSADRPPATTSP